MMQQHTFAIFVLGVVSVFLSCSTSTASVISCPPNNLEVAPNLRQLCYAIEQAISEVQNNQAEYHFDERNAPGQVEKKRQDVDHVFLRFGRRLGY